MTVTAVAANTWTVTRGQDGTTAAAAAAGAEVWIDPKPITGPLAGTELVVGQRIITWPTNNFGLAGPLDPNVFEPLVVGYGTDPVISPLRRRRLTAAFLTRWPGGNRSG